MCFRRDTAGGVLVDADSSRTKGVYLRAFLKRNTDACSAGLGAGQAVTEAPQLDNNHATNATRAEMELNRQLRDIEGSLQAIKTICCCILMDDAVLVFVK